MKLIKILFLIFISTSIFWPAKIYAQQTIIQVPSSEVLQPGEIILKDSNRFRPFNPDRFVSLGPSITVGTGWDTEITTGVSTSMSDETVVRGDFTAKKVFFISKANRLTVGTRIYPFLNDGITPHNFTFAHVSTRIRKTKTTLTSGMYLASNNQNFIPDKPGVILGLEQTLFSNKFKLAVDWTSRNESFGSLGVGFKYRPAPTLSITSGILIPNGNRSKLGFTVSISKYFSPKRGI